MPTDTNTQPPATSNSGAESALSIFKAAATVQNNIATGKIPQPTLSNPIVNEPAPIIPARQPDTPVPVVDAAPPKTNAEPADDLPDDIKKATPKTQDNWRKMKNEFNTEKNNLQKQIDEYKAKQTAADKELNEYRNNLVKNPDLDKIKQENEELRKRITAKDPTQDPRFQTYYNDKYGKEIEALKNTAGSQEKAQQFLQWMQLPTGEYKRRTWEQLTDDMADYEKNKILRVDDNIHSIYNEQQTELQRLKNDPKYQNEDKIQQETVINQRKEHLNSLLKDPDKVALEVFGYTSDDTNWNTAIAASRAEAERFATSTLSPQEHATVAARAAAYTPLRSLVHDLRDLAIKQTAQIKELTNSSPKVEANAAKQPEVPTVHSIFKEASQSQLGQR